MYVDFRTLHRDLYLLKGAFSAELFIDKKERYGPRAPPKLTCVKWVSEQLLKNNFLVMLYYP